MSNIILQTIKSTLSYMIYSDNILLPEKLKLLINSFLQMSDDDFALMPKPTIFVIRKKMNLLTQGETCKYVFFVKKGFFRMYYVDFEGNEINTRFTSENSFLVDFQSFLTRKPSKYNWQAMQPAELLAFSYDDIHKLYSSSAIWEKFGRLISEQVYLQLNERVEMLAFMSPQERYEHLMQKRPELFNQISQFHMASYLGIKPESLSRLRKRLLKSKS